MKYYAVRLGHDVPQVYTSWADCEKAVKGFKGAKFKSFPTQDLADAYLETIEDVLTTYPEGHHITVDASSSIKHNFWEFQMVWSDTKEVIYKSPTYQDGTNNTGEVMGLCYAVKYRAEHKLDCNIYTDSMTAISAVDKGIYNMKSDLISLDTRLLIMVMLGEAHDLNRDNIIHYNNRLIGIEIPADFNRK